MLLEIHVSSRKKQYYQSLRTLETLEKQHLSRLQNYRFATEMRQAIPMIKENIRSAESDFRKFPENIREFSPIIGEIAITHTKKITEAWPQRDHTRI